MAMPDADPRQPPNHTSAEGAETKMVASPPTEVRPTCQRKFSTDEPTYESSDDDLVVSLLRVMRRVPDTRKPRGKRYDGASLLSLAV